MYNSITLQTLEAKFKEGTNEQLFFISYWKLDDNIDSLQLLSEKL